jgi:organic radical activating enzyme
MRVKYSWALVLLLSGCQLTQSENPDQASEQTNTSPTKEVSQKAHELKVIMYNKSDFIFAEEQAEKVNKDCILYLQPEWSKCDKVVPEIVDYVMKNPKWKISLQTHKYLNIP